MLRQDSLKVAEARVRALTREVGALKEDVRREIKRRERAIISVREAEELRQEAEKRSKQLEYSMRKLEQEGFTSQEESRTSAAKSRAAATCAREELAAYEGSIAEQAAASHQHMQRISHHLQKLQVLLFHPTDVLAEAPLAADVAPSVQIEFEEVMHGLSHLSSSLPGHAGDLALPASCSPTRRAQPHSSPSHSELHRLRAEVATLRAQSQVQQSGSTAEQAALEMGSLIPEYRSTLARMKKQVDQLQVRLEDACQERQSLHQQVASLKKAVKLGAASKKAKRISSPGLRSEASEDEDAKRLIKDIRGLKHRCQNLEAQADALGVTNCELQTALAERGEQLQQQQNVIADLEATISAQSSDIRTALQLVTHKHGDAHSRTVDLDALVPAWHPPSSFSKVALRQRPSWQQGQQGTDASLSQRCSFAHNACLSPQRSRQCQGSQHQHFASMDMLCRDMQQLDAQIADLDENLASASHRLHP